MADGHDTRRQRVANEDTLQQHNEYEEMWEEKTYVPSEYYSRAINIKLITEKRIIREICKVRNVISANWGPRKTFAN